MEETDSGKCISLKYSFFITQKHAENIIMRLGQLRKKTLKYWEQQNIVHGFVLITNQTQ
jgi:hypothetical protein